MSGGIFVGMPGCNGDGLAFILLLYYFYLFTVVKQEGQDIVVGVNSAVTISLQNGHVTHGILVGSSLSILSWSISHSPSQFAA